MPEYDWAAMSNLERAFITRWRQFAPPDLPDPIHDSFLYAQSLGRNFRADFAWPEINVTVACDGGVYDGRAHGSISGILRDIERQNHAQAVGCLRFRVTSGMLDNAGDPKGFIELVASVVAHRYRLRMIYERMVDLLLEGAAPTPCRDLISELRIFTPASMSGK